MVSKWILIFYLAATPGGKPVTSIDYVGEFMTVEACTTAGAKVRERFEEHGPNTGFDCLENTTGRTALDAITLEMFQQQQN